jgi:hypothetical protein
MAQSLSLTLTIGAAAGAAMSVFGNLKGVMGKIAVATRDLKAKQAALGKEIAASAQLPIAHLQKLRAQYEKQKLTLDKLRASTQALGKSQAAIAANEASRTRLRGKMMETAGLAYLAARPIQIGVEFEASMSKVQALTRLDKDSAEMKALQAQSVGMAG